MCFFGNLMHAGSSPARNVRNSFCWSLLCNSDHNWPTGRATVLQSIWRGRPEDWFKDLGIGDVSYLLIEYFLPDNNFASLISYILFIECAPSEAHKQGDLILNFLSTNTRSWPYISALSRPLVDVTQPNSAYNLGSYQATVERCTPMKYMVYIFLKCVFYLS